MKQCALPLLALAMLAGASPAAAETLREALAKAYQTNPTLAGARAGQRALDENVPIASARGLPAINASGSFTDNLVIGALSTTTPERNISGRVGASLPIYQGGAVKFAVRAADARVDAGQAGLRGTESDIFTGVVAAYMDVLRDEAIVSLNRNQVRVLQTNLEATRDRFEVGDLTRTDIAQSEARLAIAQSQMQSAEATLISSRERYVQLVGNAPGALDQPPPLPNLPETPEAAVATALSNNPDLLSAKKGADAAKLDVSQARAARLPKLSAVADATYLNYLNTLGTGSPLQQDQHTASVGVQLTVPIYQGGGPGAQVRQAQARSSQSLELVIEAERGVIAQTRSAYASWRASNAVIVSSQTAVSANALSLEGVRAENSVGNRSILDILNAEQELLNAQVQLVSARRNAYVAGFALLASMGQAEARDLGLDGGILYDPEVNYRRVHNKIWDWSDDRKPVATSTRTVDTPAQNPDTSTTMGQ